MSNAILAHDPCAGLGNVCFGDTGTYITADFRQSVQSFHLDGTMFADRIFVYHGGIPGI
jgi:hypothetical protein